MVHEKISTTTGHATNQQKHDDEDGGVEAKTSKSCHWQWKRTTMPLGDPACNIWAFFNS